MGGEVAVAEPEPVGLHTVGGEFILGMPGFVAMSPAAFRVDTAAQRVHAGVEVRADPHTEHPRVVTDVHDRGQLVCRGVRRIPELPQPQQVLHAEQEAGAAHAADQNRDLHSDRH